MSIFLKACLSLFLAISSLASLEAAYDGLKKPDRLPALKWLRQLEEMRDGAEQNMDFEKSREAYKITLEISATLAGKYGLSKKRVATPAERQQMIASIVRTRHDSPNMKSILSKVYFKHDADGCWERVNNDPIYARHIGVLLAVDALALVIISANKPPEFMEKVKAANSPSTIPSTFVQAVTNIAIQNDHYSKSSCHTNYENIKKAISLFSPNTWQIIVRETSQQFISPAAQTPLETAKEVGGKLSIMEMRYGVAVAINDYKSLDGKDAAKLGYAGTRCRVEKMFGNSKLRGYARFYLGRLYEGGYGVEKSLMQAFICYANSIHGEIALRPVGITGIKRLISTVFNLADTTIFAMEETFSELDEDAFNLIAAYQAKLIIAALAIRRSEVMEYLNACLPCALGTLIINDYMGFTHVEALYRKSVMSAAQQASAEDAGCSLASTIGMRQPRVMPPPSGSLILYLTQYSARLLETQ